jgi:hypothetical protein
MAVDLVDSGYFDLTFVICIVTEDPPPPLPAGLIPADSDAQRECRLAVATSQSKPSTHASAMALPTAPGNEAKQIQLPCGDGRLTPDRIAKPLPKYREKSRRANRQDQTEMLNMVNYYAISICC